VIDQIEIQPTSVPIRGTIRPPGSKSITNRALICAALARGRSTLTGALDSEDTRVLIDSLLRLGISVEASSDRSELDIAGCGGAIPSRQAELYIANSGTSVRFLTAMLAVGNGIYRLDGTARMRERPIQDLLDALTQLQVQAVSEPGTGCPPVVLHAAGLRGGNVEVRGDVSSQFLSGLLLAAPYAQQPMTIRVKGNLVSTPYIHTTLSVMQAFGLRVEADDLRQFVVPNEGYQGTDYEIEPDASAASYFFAAAAITGGQITVEGLSSNSLQGDIRFCDSLQQMGCQVEYMSNKTKVTGPATLRGIEINMNEISDTVQTLAAVALFAEGPTIIRDVAHIRHKETDRIGNLAIELRKLGAEVEDFSDGLKITPSKLHGATLLTYDDHRMAMSLALAGLRLPGVVITNPKCTEKTYPGFFADLESVIGDR